MSSLPADLAADLAAEPDEVEDPNCLLPPLRPERKQLYGLVNKLSNLGCALVSTLIRVCRGLEPLPAKWQGSPLRAIERANRAVGLAILLLLRVRHGIVVDALPKAAPKQTQKEIKQKRKRAPASGLGLPRIEPDAATMIERMTDAQALARIRRDLTYAAKVFGYSDIVAQVTALADAAEALLARPPTPPLPPATRAAAEIQRRRAARAAAAAAMAPERESAADGAAVDAAGMAPLAPDTG